MSEQNYDPNPKGVFSFIDFADTEAGAVAAAGGGGGAPTDATFITQTANATLTAEQALAALASGFLKNATGTGVVSIANEATDPLLVRTTGGATSAAAGTGAGAVSTGKSNAFFGHNSGVVNSTGKYNSFFGAFTGAANTTGRYNTFIGYKAGTANLSGVRNSAFGAYAGFSNTTGYNNVFFGYRAGYTNADGKRNVFIGDNSGGVNVSGSFNCMMGFEAGISATGSGNCFFGRGAGDNATTGSKNLAFGYDIDLPVAAGSNQLTIGNLIFGTALDGTGTSVSSGNIGIGVPTPLAKLHIVSGGAIRLGNAAVAGAVVPTHTLTIEDSTGTVYRIPCLV